jgi:hypothetical protein
VIALDLGNEPQATEDSGGPVAVAQRLPEGQALLEPTLGQRHVGAGQDAGDPEEVRPERRRLGQGPDDLLEPTAAFVQIAPHLPQWPDARRDLPRARGVAMREGPAERRAEVVVLGLQAVEPASLALPE